MVIMSEQHAREKRWLLEEKYHGEISESYQKDVELLEKGMPLAYIIGNIPFYNCTIDLEYKPLIPRAETEYWVNLVNTQDLPKDPFSVLDLCAGSGCIGVSILKNNPFSKVDFGEIKQDNILQIQKNLRLNTISKERYSVYQSDLFVSIPKKKYHTILTNPPYISPLREDTVQESVLNFEDPLALFAEDGGLFLIKKIIRQAGEYLLPGGTLYVEYGENQTEQLKTFLEDEGISSYRILPDQYEKDRVLVITY